jgi:hypothetical protein
MSKINSYAELMAEQKRLENRIAEQKAAINGHIVGLKEKVEPFLNLVPFLNIFKKSESKGSVLNLATSIGIDLVGLKLFSRFNWVARLILPFVLKRVASRALDSSKQKSI